MMEVKQDIVSWGQAELIGPVPGSGWLCPKIDVDQLVAVHKLGGTVTPEDVRYLADGRDQHLNLYHYPEGEEYVEIVDTETGAVLTDPKDLNQYLTNRPMSNYGTINAFSGVRLPISGARDIVHVINYQEGTQTAIQPAEVPGDDYLPRLRTIMRITPAIRQLMMHGESYTDIIDGGMVTLAITQKGATVKGGLRIDQHVSGNSLAGGHLSINLDAGGQARELWVCNLGLLRIIGVQDASRMYFDETIPVEDSTVQRGILNPLAEVLGMPEWNGLDLRLTASGLYAAMAAKSYDLTKILVPAGR
jgi:hypothetical protein